MPLVRNPKNAYTGRIISCMDFPETQSLSLLVVVKTENGKAIKDKTVTMNLSEEHSLAQGIYDGAVVEVGFLAHGFSPEPVKGDEARPIFALVGFAKSSLEQVLGGDFATGEVVTDAAELSRKANMASRALAWIRAGIKKAVEE